MNTLVTGATGFIGSHLLHALVAKGRAVRALVRKTSDTGAIAGTPALVLHGDLAEEADVARAMEGCDEVYHLAAFAKNWARDERAVTRINLDALDTVLRAARAAGVRRVVYTSTVMTFGPSNGRAVDETTVRALPPATLYERSKEEAEYLVDRHVDRGLDVVTVHPSRVFGPGRLSEANSTTILIDRYMRGTFRTLPGDGSAVGNYVYVHDVVAGCIAAMERGQAGGHYILGGDNCTFSELFDMIDEAAHLHRLLLPVPKALVRAFAQLDQFAGELGLRQPVLTPPWVDVMYDDWACSSDRARRELGYMHTPLDTAIRETVAWLRRERPTQEKRS